MPSSVLQTTVLAAAALQLLHSISLTQALTPGNPTDTNTSPTLQQESQLYPGYRPSITYVAVGTAFYLLIVVISLPFTHWLVYHHGAGFAGRKNVLMQGDRSQWGAIDRFCSSQHFVYWLSLLLLVPFALLVSAAVWDNWSVYKGPDYPIPIYFGIQNAHVQQDGLGGTADYHPFCETLTTGNDDRVMAVCGLISFGAAMTVVWYALALLSYFVAVIWLILRHRKQMKAVRAHAAAAGTHNSQNNASTDHSNADKNLVDHGLWSDRLLLAFHLNGTFTALTWITWALVPHIGLQSLLNVSGSQLMFETCWWLLLAATLFQTVPQLLARRSFMRHQFRSEEAQRQCNAKVDKHTSAYSGVQLQ